MMKETNGYEILAVAAKVAVIFDRKILKIIKEGNVTSLSTTGIPSNITGIWFRNNFFYVVGSGMFKKYDIYSFQTWTALHFGITNYHLNDIKANNLNDIIACGDFGELLHFNGISWKSYQDFFSGVVLGEVAIKNNLAVISGFNNSKAIIGFGKR